MSKPSFLLILFAFILFSCRFSEIEVDSDYSYAGKFHRYKTFSFVDNQTFDGKTEEKELIEYNITRILESWGYKHKEGKTNFLINYDFYFEDVKMRGYNQPEFHYWVQSRFGKDLTVLKKDTVEEDSPYVRRRDEQYNSSKMSLSQGTIYVTFLDRKRDQSVWQGYASGVFGGDINNNERTIRAAIIRILDEFRLVTPSASS